MLKAAIAIVQGGQEKLKDSKDPFGSGPFEYKPAEGGGFELRSKLTIKDGPVTLRVGMPVEAEVVKLRVTRAAAVSARRIFSRWQSRRPVFRFSLRVNC